MPELPEVETTRRGLEPHLTGRQITQVIIRNPQLRWPIPLTLVQALPGQCILKLSRRAKYLIVQCSNGALIMHLGMSGSLRVVPDDSPAAKHDHFDLVLDGGKVMRLRDPRRFGAILWTETDALRHPLLAQLGIEPLSPEFDGDWLYAATRGRSVAIKQALMDSHLIVGVGNIYANEALFRAGIRPTRAAASISCKRYNALASAIRETLIQAIAAGGSSLRDFVNSEGLPGYFQQHYNVYGRAAQPCRQCGSTLNHARQGQRSTFFCAKCQT